MNESLEHFGIKGMKWGVRHSKNKYDPPYSKREIKKHYGKKIYKSLMKDKAHKFRAKTGIELIHKEPTKTELERIWKNWNLMSEKQKQKSDRFSLKLYGLTNSENYYYLMHNAYVKDLA